MQRFRSLAIVGVVILLLLTACARVPQRKIAVPTGTETAGAEVLSIKVLSYAGDSALDALIAAFYANYPNYRIDKVSVPSGNSAADTVKYRLSEGQVDVVATALPGIALPEMAAAGQLAELDPYIKKSKFDLQPLGTAVEQMRIDGSLYDLPYAAQPMVVLYNQDMFQAAGLPLPREGWTWDQFREAARTLTKGNGDSKVWGVSTYSPDALVSIWLFQRMAGGATFVPDEKSLREALQFFTTLILTDKAMPPMKTGTTAMYDRIPFEQGKAAMSVERLYNLTMVSQRAKFKWNVAPIPVVPGGADAQLISPMTYAIASNAPNPDGAWVFLSFAAGREGAAALAKAGQFPMYNTAEVRRAWMDRQPPPPPGAEALFSSKWQIEPRSIDSAALKQWQAMGTLFTQSLSGQRPWEEALNDYLREAERIKTETR